jgi:hypothetical protein
VKVVDGCIEFAWKGAGDTDTTIGEEPLNSWFTKPSARVATKVNATMPRVVELVAIMIRKIVIRKKKGRVTTTDALKNNCEKRRIQEGCVPTQAERHQRGTRHQHITLDVSLISY